MSSKWCSWIEKISIYGIAASFEMKKRAVGSADSAVSGAALIYMAGVGPGAPVSFLSHHITNRSAFHPLVFLVCSNCPILPCICCWC